MSKPAPAAFPIHELNAQRFSPYSYADKPVSEDDLRALFEAARWAPSSYNEQPWVYLVARREQTDLFVKVLSCLVEGNQAWAKFAPVLAIGCVRTHFKLNEKPNKHCAHDLGLASMALTVEATSRNLFVHQMAGILPDKVRELFSLPQDCEAMTGLAIGYHGDGANLPEALQQRDQAPRKRNPQSEWIFGGTWGETADWAK